MKNLFRNLIPYKSIVLLVLLLMIAQAFCEMMLPQYTQNMIDVGIIDSGVEHILPEAVTAGEFDALKSVMTADEAGIIDSVYELSAESSGILIREDMTESDLDELDSQLIRPVVTRYRARLGGSGDTAGTDTAEVTAPADAVSLEEGDAGYETDLAMGVAYAVMCDEEAGVDITAIQNAYMWKTGAMMMLMSFLTLGISGGISFFASRVGAGIGRSLRSRLFRNVMSFSNAEMSRFQTSSLITRATNDIQQVQMTSTMMLRMMLFAPCICTWSIIRVYQTHAHMNYVIITGVIAILLMVGTLFVVAMPKFKIMQQLVDALNAVSREILTGIQVIRAFGREKTEEERFDKANSDLYRNQLFVNRTMISMSPMLMIIMYGLSVWITWVAAGKIDLGEMQVGTMTAFIAYSMEIVFSFLMIASMAIFLPRAGVAADRIAEVLDTGASITDRPDAGELRGDNDGTVRFEHVSFRYPDAEEDVLTDIDFEARPGETTAIIGSTGCGKTTLVSLIPRFFDVTEGRITVGGQDIRDITLSSLRDSIGYVPQKGVLFSGTIASNISWGRKDADDKDIAEAAEIAQAVEFIDDKPERYDSEISQGGANVSGGQKQRLSIARAIIKDPKILIFDDSFSALDMKTDAALRKALAEKTGDSVRIIVAQRVGTILHAEQIIVLDEGRIAGSGTHSELLRTCSIYRDIAKSQLSESELGI